MTTSLFDLQGRVALITGGSGVLGSVMAKSLVAAGAKVAIMGRTRSKVEQTVRKIDESERLAVGLIADVLNKAQLQEAGQTLLSHWGKIDILVNAAGGNMPGATVGPQDNIFNLDSAAFSQVMELNLTGTVLPSLVFGELMVKNGGSIINISSMAAEQALTRVAGYSAAKAAVNNFTRWLSVELALRYGEKIRVNAIAPGFFIADQNRKLLLDEDGRLTERGQHIINQTPFRRFGRPEELCGALQWLSSEASSFVTGIVIPVDGGFSAFSGV